MAELLVRVTDKTHADAYANQTHCKRGDVIVACPDGWNWGNEEVKNLHTAIIKVPGLSEREAQAMTTEEIGDRKINPMLHARAFYLDFLDLPATQCSSRIIEISVPQFRAARNKRVSLKNPFVIGY